MVESTAISIKKFHGTDYKGWTLEVEILLEQKQVPGIVDGTEEAPDAKNGMDATKFKPLKKQHGIARLPILLALERSVQQQYGVQRREGGVGSAEGGLQVEGDAECVGFER